jgi:hypothetical protein
MTEAQPFFTWGAGGAQMTPERIASERKVAQALMERGMDYSPVQHWTQGVSRVAQALMGGVDSRMADAAERRNVDADKDMIAGWFGGQRPVVPATAGAAALPPPSVAPAPSSAPVVIGEGGLAKPDAGGVYDADAVLMPNSTAHGPAIAGIETPGSKDPYAAIGPATRTGARAHGKYQVMDFNIGPWTKEVLGRELTPDQFRASPDAQEAIFNQKFGQGAKSPQDAASMWFTGRPAAEGASSRAVTPAGVPYGPTGRSYVDMFTKKLGPTAPPADSPALALAAPQGGAPAIAAPAATPTPVAPVTAAAAPTGIAGVNPSMLAAITSPYTSEGTKKIAQIMLQHQMAGDAVTHVDLGGQVGIMDKRGNIIKTVQKTEPTKAPSIVDGPVDPATGYPTKLLFRGDGKYDRVTLPPDGGPASPSTIPPAPSGVDPKIWREMWSKSRVADATPGSFDDTTKLRSEFTQLPAYKNMAQAAPIYQTMRDAAGRDTKAADLNIVYGLGKIMDPGSVVREGEVVLANNAQGWQEKLNGYIAQINSKGSLTPEGRRALMAEAHSRITAYKSEFDRDAARYKGIAERNRMKHEDVIPDFGAIEPWEPAKPPPPEPVVVDGYKIQRVK